MTTLPNEPLQITITEAAREAIALRVAAREALKTFDRIRRAEGQFFTERVESMLRAALGDPEPQTCAGCGCEADRYDGDGFGECCAEFSIPETNDGDDLLRQLRR